MAGLKKVCDSALNLKIITFFRENPTTVDTADGIATWLNHDRKQIQKALDCLAGENILIAHRTGTTIAYAYTQDKKLIEQIEVFLRNKE